MGGAWSTALACLPAARIVTRGYGEEREYDDDCDKCHILLTFVAFDDFELHDDDGDNKYDRESEHHRDWDDVVSEKVLH